jgi:hypothetical protein
MAASADGQVMAIAHFQEILVHSAVDESPLWQQHCETDVATISAQAGFVFALDRSETIHRWDALTGKVHETISFPEHPLGMAVNEAGDCAVFSQRRLYLLCDLKIVQSIDQSSINTIGWSSGSEQKIAIGDRTGQLWFFDWNTSTGLNRQPSGSLKLECAVEYIVWDNRQSWIVIAGGEIWQVGAAGQGSKKVFEKTPEPAGLAAMSKDGNCLAVTIGQQTAFVFRMGQSQMAGPGHINYQDRIITGLGFGLGGKLLIGLDTGDGNIIDLGKPEGSIARTDPHPGRLLNRWMLSFDLTPVLPRSGATYDRNSNNPLTAYLATREEIHQYASAKSYPAWAGPVLGMIAGLVFGAKMAKEFPGKEAIAFAIGIGIGGLAGSIVMLLDLSRKH